MNNLNVYSELSAVHELEKRIRLRYNGLRSNRIDPAKLSSGMLCLNGVDSCRVSLAAASVAVRYDGRSETKRSIIKLLLLTSKDCQAIKLAKIAPKEGNKQLRNLFLAAIPILHYSFLPAYLRFVMTLMTTAPMMLSGVQSALKKRQITTELIDTVAIGISTFTGEYLTGNFTHLLLQPLR